MNIVVSAKADKSPNFTVPDWFHLKVCELYQKKIDALEGKDAEESKSDPGSEGSERSVAYSICESLL